MDQFAKDMTTVLYGNPHSGSWPSQLSTSRIEDIRLQLLRFFNASPEEYDLVFVPNATSGVKLVVESMRALPRGYYFAYHQACHTSLVGAREDAVGSSCLDDGAMAHFLDSSEDLENAAHESTAVLFAYTAQSHMNGRRYPLTWPKRLREKSARQGHRILTLLDAASYCATSPLDLGNPGFLADFVTLSLYKIFGFPDLGALIVRRSSEDILHHRRYFGGGTVDTVVCEGEQWHAPKTHFLHERLEDGTLPFHSIMALGSALVVHRNLFGSMDQVSSHVSSLTGMLLETLQALRHGNGEHVCAVYTKAPAPDSNLGVGPVVSFNIRSSRGAWLSLFEFEKLAALRCIHVRTGGLCSPGGIAEALSLRPWELRKNFSAGFRCGTENDIVAGKPTGVIRVSFGAMSTKSDVRRLAEFLREFFVENSVPNGRTLTPSRPGNERRTAPLHVRRITVFPIKSCAGFDIPAGRPWEVRPEGLAWDREWCLLHRGTREALVQKRCPKMALLQPSLDFDLGLLSVTYLGEESEGTGANRVFVPLSADPSNFDQDSHRTLSQVCGDKIFPQIYVSKEVNDFFTRVLRTPCVLARFPPGGRGLRSRSSKAKMQRHQQDQWLRNLSESFPETSPAGAFEPEMQTGAKILLSNESPILMIYQPSVDALNEAIRKRGGHNVDEAAFRANVIVACPIPNSLWPAYSEDSWKSVSIGSELFTPLGACRRCQMVCVNPRTSERKSEPLATLAKTRRFDGKIFFGIHMCLGSKHASRAEASQNAMIRVGDPVYVEGMS